MGFKKIKFQRAEWALEIWGETRVLYLKLCRSWDGQFVVDKAEGVLPLAGFRREDRDTVLEDEPTHKVTREMRGWRLWVPYFMVWYLRNMLDRKEVYVPDDDPRVGTTVRVR